MLPPTLGAIKTEGLPGVASGGRIPSPARTKAIVAALTVAGILLVIGIAYLANVLSNPRMTLIPAPVAKQSQVAMPVYRFSIYGKQDLPLLRPLAVTEAPDGSVYVTDTGNSVVQVFDHNGRYKSTIGKPGGEKALGGELVFPVGLAVDDKGTIFVTDSRTGHISAFSAKGEFLGYFGESESGKSVEIPAGITFKDDRFFVTDLGTHKIAVLDYKGDKLFEVGAGRGEEEGQLQYPNCVIVDAKGKIYVADSNNNRVQIFGPDGNLLQVIKGGDGASSLNLPRGISIDGKGLIHIVSVFSHQVKVFDGDGAFVYAYGERGERDGELDFPNGISIVGKRTYIADRENNRIQVWEE